MSDDDGFDNLKHEVHSLQFQVTHHEAVLDRIERAQATLTESLSQFMVYEHKHAETQETIKRIFKRLEAQEHITNDLQKQRFGPRVRDLESNMERVCREVPLANYMRTWIERVTLLVIGAALTYAAYSLPPLIGG